jgi:AcrR family transcriptional regulator
VARAGRPKGDKRDRTRPQLLEAARALIREKGYEHTTLDAIAERAGMTTGAIYGNFKNRDELFISLGQTYWAPIKPHVQRTRPSPKSCEPWLTPHSRQYQTAARLRSVV